MYFSKQGDVYQIAQLIVFAALALVTSAKMVDLCKVRSMAGVILLIYDTNS